MYLQVPDGDKTLAFLFDLSAFSGDLGKFCSIKKIGCSQMLISGGNAGINTSGLDGDLNRRFCDVFLVGLDVVQEIE